MNVFLTCLAKLEGYRMHQNAQFPTNQELALENHLSLLTYRKESGVCSVIFPAESSWSKPRIQSNPQTGQYIGVAATRLVVLAA